MKYIEARIFTSREGLEPLTTMLLQLGISDTVVEDPAELSGLLEKKNAYEWDYIDKEVLALESAEPNVKLYLEDSEEGRKTLQAVKLAAMELKGRELDGEFGPGISLGRLYVEDSLVDDSEWKNSWKTYFKPAKVTDRLVIKPTWEEYRKTGEELVIEIDPGMAFGTGTHPTTSMCMKFMERYAGQFEKVLDVGTGSGILSIAAGLLGAKEVLGVEIDPEAVAIARENIKQNGMEEIIRIEQGDLTKQNGFKANLVVANLMADLVMLLAEDVMKNLEDTGLFISSGILIEKQDGVKASIKQAGFEILDIMEEGEWCAILARLRKR